MIGWGGTGCRMRAGIIAFVTNGYDTRTKVMLSLRFTSWGWLYHRNAENLKGW